MEILDPRWISLWISKRLHNRSVKEWRGMRSVAAAAKVKGKDSMVQNCGMYRTMCELCEMHGRTSGPGLHLRPEGVEMLGCCSAQEMSRSIEGGGGLLGLGPPFW